ncbi:winged helix-turn-helix transcriptional regulator [Agromyces intestinalis]|uniref:Winged helix-turn-helix transcriptional regulator n=1 Tax=Agromyces intestinalis TaxID=2592652 RepID=A0A5C1YI50_9MICO|nr:metalloregulator ArsR/SmtB family transcription factor [Agromyces intestinalis]QEO15643.1 winged helix-turn-helix transcriptional regulator [Agromyces intestinalis]
MGTDFSVLGRALAVPARSEIVSLLMDGSRRPAGELAAAAGVSASTASEHLAVLVDAGLLVVESRGRQRFFRIAHTGVAAALEQLGALARPTPVHDYRRHREARDLASGRYCYDHLAGAVGVAIADAFVAQGVLDRFDDEFALAADATDRLDDLGIDLDAVRAHRRATVLACLDWTERRFHLAGALGQAVAARATELGWVRRRTGSRRGVEVTEAGRRGLAGEWGVALTEAGSGVGREG